MGVKIYDEAPTISEEIGRRNEQRRKANKAARHVRLYYALLQSAAWAALTSKEQAAYINVFCTAYNGSNNGRIAVSNAEVMRGVKCSSGSAVTICRKLIEVRLIELVLPGIYTKRGGKRRSAEWRLTDFYCDVTKTKSSRAWNLWQPARTPQPEKCYPSATKALPLSHESDAKNANFAEARKSGISSAHDRSIESQDRSARKVHIELAGSYMAPAPAPPTATGRSPTSSPAATLNGEAHPSPRSDPVRSEQKQKHPPKKRSALGSSGAKIS